MWAAVCEAVYANDEKSSIALKNDLLAFADELERAPDLVSGYGADPVILERCLNRCGEVVSDLRNLAGERHQTLRAR